MLVISVNPDKTATVPTITGFQPGTKASRVGDNVGQFVEQHAQACGLVVFTGEHAVDGVQRRRSGQVLTRLR